MVTVEPTTGCAHSGGEVRDKKKKTFANKQEFYIKEYITAADLL